VKQSPSSRHPRVDCRDWGSRNQRLNNGPVFRARSRTFRARSLASGDECRVSSIVDSGLITPEPDQRRYDLRSRCNVKRRATGRVPRIALGARFDQRSNQTVVTPG
jgi:hypothetical protein